MSRENGDFLFCIIYLFAGNYEMWEGRMNRRGHRDAERDLRFTNDDLRMKN